MNSLGIALLAIGAMLIVAFPFLYKKYMQDWQDEVDQVGEYDPFKRSEKTSSERANDPEA